MKLRIAILSIAALTAMSLTVCQPARASQIAYEGFGQSFPIYANGGIGFSGPWTQGGFNVAASGYVANPVSLSFPSLEASAFGSVSGDAFPAINGAIRNLAQPLGADDTTIYLSFFLRPDGTLNQGVFNGFFGVTLKGSLFNDLFIGKPGGGALGQYVLNAGRFRTGPVRHFDRRGGDSAAGGQSSIPVRQRLVHSVYEPETRRA